MLVRWWCFFLVDPFGITAASRMVFVTWACPEMVKHVFFEAWIGWKGACKSCAVGTEPCCNIQALPRKPLRLDRLRGIVCVCAPVRRPFIGVYTQVRDPEHTMPVLFLSYHPWRLSSNFKHGLKGAKPNAVKSTNRIIPVQAPDNQAWLASDLVVLI